MIWKCAHINECSIAYKSGCAWYWGVDSKHHDFLITCKNRSAHVYYTPNEESHTNKKQCPFTKESGVDVEIPVDDNF